MDVTQDRFAYVGYGAILALYGVLTASLSGLSAAINESLATDAPFDHHPYRAAAVGIVAALEDIPPSPSWDDARRQFLALAERYHELVAGLPPDDMVAFRAAAAEVAEAWQVSGIVMRRLGRRLGFVGAAEP
jgi:hypothetical protein